MQDLSLVPSYISAEEITVSNMLLTKLKDIETALKNEYKSTILKALETRKDEREIIELFSSVSLLETLKNKEVVFIQNFGHEYFPYHFINDGGVFIPFKEQSELSIKDLELFSKHFSDKHIEDISSYSFLPKEQLKKALGLTGKNISYTEIISKMPTVLQDIIKIEENKSISYTRNAIQWDDARQIAKKNKLLNNAVEKITSHSINTKTLSLKEVFEIKKLLEMVRNTGESYLHDSSSKHFESKYFSHTTSESIDYDNEELKRRVLEEGGLSIYSLVKASTEGKNVGKKLKELVTTFDCESAGVKEEKSIMIMSAQIKSEKDIERFIKEMPENYYHKDRGEALPDELQRIVSKLK